MVFNVSEASKILITLNTCMYCSRASPAVTIFAINFTSLYAATHCQSLPPYPTAMPQSHSKILTSTQVLSEMFLHVLLLPLPNHSSIV